MPRTTSPAAASGLPEIGRPPLVSRRQALQAGVVVASASAVAVASPALGAVGNSDAAVSYLWREFDLAHATYQVIVESSRRAGRDTDDLEYEGMLDRVDEIVRRVADTPCSTLDGLRIKAKVAADPDFGSDGLAASIIEDLNDEEFGR